MPRDRITHRSQRFVSPDGKQGYLAIHRCGSSSIAQWLQYDSGMNWQRGGNFRDCERIFVVVRNPVDRWVSAAALFEKWSETGDREARTRKRPEDEMAKRPGVLWTNDDDAHFAAQADFIAPYVGRGLPLEFVRLQDVDAYFVSRGWTPPPNINESDESVKARLAALAEQDDGRLRKQIRSQYADDVALVQGAWTPPARSERGR